MSEPLSPRPDPAAVSKSDVGKLARGGALNLAGSMSQSLFNAGIALVLGRTLGAGGTGALLQVIGIVSILAAVTTLGVDTGLVRTVSRERVASRIADLPRVLGVSLIPVALMGVALMAVVWVTSDDLARLFGGTDQVAEMARYLDLIAPFLPLLGLHLALLGATRGYETMLPTVAVERIGRPGLQLLLITVAAVVGLSGDWLALAWAAPIPFCAAMGANWLRRLVKRDAGSGHRSDRSLGELAKTFWAFTLPRAFAAVFRMAVQWLDVLLVGGLMTPADAGVYAISTRLLQFGLAVAHAVGQISQPMISRMMANDDTRGTENVFQLATSWQVAMTWPQYLAVAAFAPFLLSIFGDEFVAGTATVTILAASALIGSGLGPVDVVLLMAGKSMWSFWNTGLSLGVNIGLNLVLIPRLGITGAALAWAASRIVGNVVPLLQIRRLLGIQPFGAGWRRAAGVSTAAFLLPGVAARYLLGATLSGAVAYGLVAVSLYGALLYWSRHRLELPTAADAFRRRFSRRPGPGAGTP